MTQLDLLRRRYATKRFDGRTITHEQLSALKEAIRLSPSSMNGQPWKVTIVSDATTKAKLKPLSWDQEQITTCSHLFVFSVPKDIPARFQDVYALMEANKVPANGMAGYKGMVEGFLATLTPEQQVAWAQRQLYLALMSLMLQATELGLDSCPMEGFDPAGYAETLGLEGQVPTVICAIGHAADTPREKLRLDSAKIFL